IVSALKPVRRQFTAREAAERLGVTTRTVQRLMAADEFSRGPMSESEVAQIAKSIAGWVWGNITPEQTKANRARWAKNLEQGRVQKMKERLEALEAMNSERT
ncbi:hypothetical protein BUE67_14000, partial [Corynebacterium diphtheriae]